MKNNDIVQMLLDDGESQAIPNQIKENPRSLALRHGNCVEKKSKTNFERRSFNENKKDHFQSEKESDLFNKIVDKYGENDMCTDKLKTFDKLNTSQHFSGHCFETLIESILLCQNHYSFIIGIFFKYATYFRSQNVHRIKEFIAKRYFPNETFKLRLSIFLILLVLFSSIICGYFCGLIISWEVGLAVGFTILFVLFTGIGLILIGTYCQEWKMALQAGSIVHNSVRSIKLSLKIFFLNPSTPKELYVDGLKVIYNHLVLCNFSNNYHAIAKFIENIWSSIEKDHSTFLIRMQKASLNQDHGDRKFKRICCLPTFVYFMIALLCILSLGTVIKVHESNISSIFKNRLALIGICFITIILFLCIIVLLYLLLKIICCIIHSPTHNLKGFLKSYNIYGEASTQAFLMSEFNCVTKFLSQLNSYENDRRSFIVAFIDVTGTADIKFLIDFCSFCQILLKNRNDIPMCIIILADNRMYAITKSSNSTVDFIKFSKMLSLSLYFDDCSTLSMFEAYTNSVLLNNNNEVSEAGDKTFDHENIHYIGINSRNDNFKPDVIIQKFYRTVEDGNNDLMNEEINIKEISDYLMIKSKLSDFNVPFIKDLILTSTFAYKLSKIQNISTDLYKLIDLITFFYHWPFLYSWMTIFIQNNSFLLKKSLVIRKIYETFMRNMLESVMEEPYILEISKMDLDCSILESVMIHNYIGELTIEEFLILNSICQLQNQPIQIFLKDAVKKSQITKSKDSFYGSLSEKSYSSKTKGSLTLSQNNKVENSIESDKGRNTPKNVRKCIQHIKEIFSSLILSEMSLENVIWIIGEIDDISKENVVKYQERIKEINASGLVLASCNPAELKNELQMTFGDWHLFYTLISYLKSIEETNESNLFQEVSEPVNKVSPYNPLLLLEKNNPLLMDLYENNSNEVVSEESNSKLCEKCSINNKINISSDTDSIWKRKTCPHGSNISKDNFLSPLSVSSISSPKAYNDSMNQIALSKSYVNPITEIATFYSVRESKLDNSFDNDIFLQRTKSLPRDASFESTTTFSTQLSSPRNSKCLYDVDSKTKTYTIPSDKYKKTSMKIKHNLGCQSYNHLQSESCKGNTNEVSIDDIAVLVDVPPSKFQTYLKKADRLYHSSLFDIDTSYLNRSQSIDKKHKQEHVDSKKSYSHTNVHKHLKKRKHSTKNESSPIVVKAMDPIYLDRDNMNSINYNVHENEPDIIFRTKEFSNETEILNTRSVKTKKDDRQSAKEKSKKSSKHRTNYGDILSFEVSHSEI